MLVANAFDWRWPRSRRGLGEAAQVLGSGREGELELGDLHSSIGQ
jgi:hypothetical protein